MICDFNQEGKSEAQRDGGTKERERHEAKRQWARRRHESIKEAAGCRLLVAGLFICKG